jgi:hypothetical protein
LIAGGLFLGALSIGVAGYRVFAGLSWVDSYLNAAMILGGMGQVDVLRTTAAKVFAATYALFAGTVFVAGVGVVMAPFIHRTMHHFHVGGRSAGGTAAPPRAS